MASIPVSSPSLSLPSYRRGIRKISGNNQSTTSLNPIRIAIKPLKSHHHRRRVRVSVSSTREASSSVVVFRNLDADDFRHPLDRQNTLILRAIPGLKDIGKALLGTVAEQVMLLENIATSIIVTENQSQKRKQDLLAEMLLEDQRGRELSKIVKELLPDSRNSSEVQKPSRARKRSTDRNRMSKQLTEEAERYFEDFVSNVEDTDISSFDGERSDESSTLGGTTKPRVSTLGITENLRSPAVSNPHTVEMEGVILPWLQWETSNDGSLKDKNKLHTPVTPKTLQWEAEQEAILKGDDGKYSTSSHGSSNTELINGRLLSTNEASKEKHGGSGIRQRSSFDMSDYLTLCNNEEVLFERYKERHQMHSGGILLCTNVL